jgi:hypothetical protein
VASGGGEGRRGGEGRGGEGRWRGGEGRYEGLGSKLVDDIQHFAVPRKRRIAL